MSEERDAVVLRVLEAELPPSTVDIDRAVRAGRRRERRRRGLAVGAALAGVVVAAGAGLVAVNREPDPPGPVLGSTSTSASVPSACVATRLAGPAGATASYISPNGRFIAGGTDADPIVPLLWTDGSAAALPVPAGVGAEPHAVNDDGVVVGLARRDNRMLPFVIRGGAYAELPVPPAAEGVAHGVNARGDAVGEMWWPNGDSKAVLWPASGQMTTLPATGHGASARAIADDGTVLGTLDDGAVPYAWSPGGTGRALPTPQNSGSGKVFGVAGDYAYGHAGTAPQPTGAVGADRGTGRDGDQKVVPTSQPRWVRWQLSTGAVVEVTGLTATGVDATGAVVGFVRQGDHFTPARWHDGKITLLPGPDSAEAAGTQVATSRDGTRLAGGTLTWRC
jgi:hypothetical protein